MGEIVNLALGWSNYTSTHIIYKNKYNYILVALVCSMALN